MCGMAIAALGITSEEFYDMSPVEFYYAIQAVSEQRQNVQMADTRERYEMMRLQTVLLINHQIGREVRYQYKNVEDLIKFRWEEGISKKQSVDEMKRTLLGIGLIFGGDKPMGHKKLDDPPTALLNKQQK